MKRHFKKEKINCLVNEVEPDYKKIIGRSFRKLSKETVVKCIDKSMNLL